MWQYAICGIAYSYYISRVFSPHMLQVLEDAVYDYRVFLQPQNIVVNQTAGTISECGHVSIAGKLIIHVIY